MVVRKSGQEDECGRSSLRPQEGRELVHPRVHASFPGGASGKESACQCKTHQETRVPSLGREDPLEEGTATHSSILAWRNLWTEEHGELQSTGSQSQKRLKRFSTHIPLPFDWGRRVGSGVVSGVGEPQPQITQQSR